MMVDPFGSGNICADVTRVNSWNRIATDVYISTYHNAVDLLENIKRHFLVRIDEWHDLEL